MRPAASYIQGFLLPWMREDNDPITEALGRLVTTLDVIGLEAFVPEPPRGPGRPPEDRRALARAFVAKAVLGVPTTSALIERLDVAAQSVASEHPRLGATLASSFRCHVPRRSPNLRRRRAAAATEFHAALIERALGGRIDATIARDATEIEAREKPVQNKANDGKDDFLPAPHTPPLRSVDVRARTNSGQSRSRRASSGQVTQNLGQMLADLPTACDVGSKKNSKGYK